MKILTLALTLIFCAGLAWAQSDEKSQPAPKPIPALDQLKGQDGAAAPAEAPAAKPAPLTGIGVSYIHKADGFPQWIGDVIENSPAEQAGLKTGDYIVEIDSVAVAPMTPEQVDSKLAGPPGSQVTLKIERRDQTTKQTSTFSVTITRRRAASEVLAIAIMANEDLKKMLADLDLSTLTAKNQQALQEKADYNYKATLAMSRFLKDSQEIMEDYRKDKDANRAARRLSGRIKVVMQEPVRLMNVSAWWVELDGKDLDAAVQSAPFSDAFLADLAVNVGKQNAIRALNELPKLCHAQLGALVADGAKDFDSFFTLLDYAMVNAKEKRNWEGWDKNVTALLKLDASLPPKFYEKLKKIAESRAYNLADSADAK